MLEGGEGVGKTTQWRRLASQLEAGGHDVVALREPGGTAAGDRIRNVLLDPDGTVLRETEALLFAASRAELVGQVLRPALARGAVVVVDRFLLSTYAYQGAGRGLAVDALHSINHFSTGGLAPTLTLLLTMSLDEALARMQQRGTPDRMERETHAFHARVHGAFAESAASAWQLRHPEVGPVVTVDASGTEDVVTTRCMAQLELRWPDRFHARAGVMHG